MIKSICILKTSKQANSPGTAILKSALLVFVACERENETCTKTTKYQNPPRTTNKQKTKTKKWNSKAPWKGELQGAVSWQCHVASSLISPFSKALFISEVKKHSIWGSTEGCQAGCWQLFYFISQFYVWKMRWQTQWSSCLDGLGLR